MRDAVRTPSERGADAAVVAFLDPLARVVVDLQRRHAVVELIEVGELVDEPCLSRRFGRERAFVEQAPHFVRRLLPRFGDAANELLVEVAIERLGHFAVLGGEALLRELVHRRLVGADVDEVGIRAQLVERAAKKDFVRRDAGQVERARRQQEHAIRRAGEVILAVAAVFEKRHHGFPGSPEVDDRIAQFLHLAPERQLERRRQQQH